MLGAGLDSSLRVVLFLNPILFDASTEQITLDLRTLDLVSVGDSCGRPLQLHFCLGMTRQAQSTAC